MGLDDVKMGLETIDTSTWGSGKDVKNKNRNVYAT